jgi:hypothetical protein
MASTCLPHLPDELFIQVLQNVNDPFVLWVTCRQVSQAWKTEAEGAFRATYLPLLRIEWTEVQFGRVGYNLIATPDKHPIDRQSSTLSLLVISSRPKSGKLSNFWGHSNTREEMEDAAHWIKQFGDYDSWVYGHGFENNLQAIWFDTVDGRYTFVSSAETHAFDLRVPVWEQDERGHYRFRVTCDWKALIDALFMEERYVRYKRPGSSFYELGEQSIRASLANAEQAIKTRTTASDADSLEVIVLEGLLYQENVKTLLRKHCHQNEEYKCLYAAAFRERLRLAFSRRGGDLYMDDIFTRACDSNKRLSFNLERTGCWWVMQSRLDRLQAFADGIWKSKFGRSEELSC